MQASPSEFLDARVLAWVPRWCEALAAVTVDPFHAALLRLGPVLWELDRDELTSFLPADAVA